jgi:hypothetical protein
MEIEKQTTKRGIQEISYEKNENEQMFRKGRVKTEGQTIRRIRINRQLIITNQLTNELYRTEHYLRGHQL